MNAEEVSITEYSLVGVEKLDRADCKTHWKAHTCTELLVFIAKKTATTKTKQNKKPADGVILLSLKRIPSQMFPGHCSAERLKPVT